MKILGIETSCDETAASVIEANAKEIKVLSNIISSQIEIHQKYGGVVPEVAAREHVLNILPVINEALEKAGIKRKEAPKKLNAIAVTIGPGLITSLIVGVETAKTLAYVWKLPIVPINHIEGHIYANFIGAYQKIKLPAIILTVSGGHTMLVLMKKHGQLKTIGDTRDDAAGEAFDKAAKLMNIGCPGGPAIEAEATKFLNKSEITNHKSEINLPRPMLNSGNFDFSFSGLKTALLYQLKKDKQWRNKIPAYAYEFQQAIIDVLVGKTIKAAKKFEVKTVMLAGGVAANTELRAQLKNAVEQKLNNIQFCMPNLEYTTDNAAMVATAGYFKAKRKKTTNWTKLKSNCNLKL
ncbi:MAG: tRNA (adenosine(37)-N6)-threonylcarbamoyltransferase complex transferase subunit TsaD [Candidatus Falkowbacteria bacterium]|nr:tRNA (adenosine(37)-N6)-threonylcarbamoyltransferase complex transferase subunit TsaD [Candidatus Falkowbacteria bacterium]